MFDFLSWPHIAVIAAAALIFIGPKDMPVAIRSITTMLKKARRMAGEFQGQMDELVREANLTEVRDGIAELRSGLNVRNQIGKLVDPDHTIRSALSDPLNPTTSAAGYGSEAETAPVEAVAVGEFPEYAMTAPEDALTEEEAARPAFIPPGISLTEDRPAFIPPGIRR